MSKKAKIEKPEPGDLVHYVLPATSKRSGECRPGIIVRVLDGRNWIVRLFVMLDGLEDEPLHGGAERLVGVRHNEFGAGNTYHYRGAHCPNHDGWKTAG